MAEEIKKEVVEETKEEEMVTISKAEYDNLKQVAENSVKVANAFNKLMETHLKMYSNQLVAELLADKPEGNN